MNGDLYGGAMYIESADISPQGIAIREATAKWGSELKTCKYKFQPTGSDGRKRYGCHLHSILRERRVKRAGGPRPEWESFDQFWGSSTMEPVAKHRKT